MGFKFITTIKLLHLIILTAISFSLIGEPGSRLGSRSRPVTIAIVPAKQANKTMGFTNPLAKCLEENSGYSVSITVPNSLIAVVESIGSKKIHMAIGEILTYYLARKKYGVEPLLKVLHHGKKGYYSMILVRSESFAKKRKEIPIKSLTDLNQKAFAYSDASSVSSFIYPHIEFKKQNIQLSQDLSTGSMDAAISALMQGRVAAAGAYYTKPKKKKDKDGRVYKDIKDARRILISIYPDIEKKTKVLWVSQEIPNEPIMVQSGLSAHMKDKFRSAFKTCFQKLPLKYNDIDGVLPVDKKAMNEYEAFLTMISKLSTKISDVIQQKDKLKSLAE